jgi:hypothetical protein
MNPSWTFVYSASGAEMNLPLYLSNLSMPVPVLGISVALIAIGRVLNPRHRLALAAQRIVLEVSTSVCLAAFFAVGI